MIDVTIEYAELLRAPYVDGGRSVKTGIDCWGVCLYVLGKRGFKPRADGEHIFEDDWICLGGTVAFASCVGDVITSLQKGKVHASVLASVKPTRVVLTTAARAGVVAIPLGQVQNVTGVYRMKQS